MNKILITLGVGIWGVTLILGFILSISLSSMNLTNDQIQTNLIPLTIIEIIAFIIALLGILRRD